MKMHIISWNVSGLSDIEKRVIKFLIQERRTDIYCTDGREIWCNCQIIVQQ